MKQTSALEKIFRQTTGLKQIHEAVLLVENTKGDLSVSCGYGDKHRDSPLTMASTAKLFTTVCILQLWEQGRLSLEDKVARYVDEAVLEGLHVYKGRQHSFELTVADLLFQISGLPDYFEEGSNMRKRTLTEDYRITFAQMVEETKKLRPHFAPQPVPSRAYYSDINFDLMGHIIEHIEGLPLEKVYEERIFQPLGLTRTYLPTGPEHPVPEIYYKDQRLHRPQAISSYRASGGCITTAGELMVFLKGFFNGALFPVRLLEKLAVYRRLQLSMGPIRYGGGFMQIPLRSANTLFMGKGELLGHSGTTGSFAFYYPLKDLYMVGDLNQLAHPSYAIRLVMKLAMGYRA
jgi:D-alanyl-D-alanine carboxypeptidase